MDTTAQDATARRVRSLIERLDPQERRMFGTIAFMVDGAMLLAVDREGGLLARVPPERDAELLQRPHAERSEMGAGRSMGIGWIRVAPDGIATDRALEDWVGATLERLEAARVPRRSERL